MNIGALLRKCRKEQKLTLKAVAEKSSISEGFLSQVENSVSSPSVETLMRICNALGVNAGELLSQVSKQENRILIRKSEWDEIDCPHTGFVTRRFFPPEDRQVIDSAILVIEPEKSIPVRKNIKNGQEILCVLRGTVRLQHGDTTVELNEGDSIHYRALSSQQKIFNTTDSTSIVLWVGTL